MKRNLWLLVALAGCMHHDTRADEGVTASREPFAVQAEKGERIFADSCSRCHGDYGEGTKKAPRLIGLGEGALPLNPPKDGKERRGQFHTVGDVGTYAKRFMPPLETGSLTEDAYWRVVAFILKSEGIDLGDQHLDRTVADTLQLPGRATTSRR